MPYVRFQSQKVLSIIVPWMGNDNAFENTLASVLRNQPEESEIIVPHDKRYVDRYGLQDEVVFCEVSNPDSPNCESNQPASLRSLFNAALKISSGQFVNLIRPSVEVDENWSSRPLEIFNGNSMIGSVSMPILNARKPKNFQTFGINHTSRLKRRLVGGKTSVSWQQLNRQVIGPSSWCAFYSRVALSDIRGVDGQIGDAFFGDSVFDLDIALALKLLGYRNQVAADYSVSSGEELELQDMPLFGCDASRLAMRYANCLGLNAVSTKLLGIVSELATALISPSHAKFALNRLKSGKFHSADKQYAELLAARRPDSTQYSPRTSINRAA